MSVDGGGTKIQALLFDESGARLGFGQGGPINPNFSPMELVRKSMGECIAQCLAGFSENHLREGARIKTLYITMPGPHEVFRELLVSRVPVDETRILTEGRLGVLSGALSADGYCALSGTGSGAFFSRGETRNALGGWGSLLGDEGSGFDIGRRVLVAVTRAHDGWGEKTALTELVMEHYGLKVLRDLVPTVYHAPEYRAVIAQSAKLAARAASEGDAVALLICRRAGADMARQMLALMRRNAAEDVGGFFPVTVCGGAWKGHASMFATFAKAVSAKMPGREPRYPLYEALAGGVALMFIETGRKNDIERLMERACSDLRHPLPAGWREHPP